MIKMALRQTRRWVKWFKQNRALDTISTMEEFQKYIELTQPDFFSYHESNSLQRRRSFQAVVEKLRLPIRDKTVLDIGPGHGEMLDICHELGAKNIHFVEWYPLFYAYNRLKGFTKGYCINHLWRLRILESSKYDLIWARGSFQMDPVLNNPLLFSIEDWINQVERIAAPGGWILICPYFCADDLKRRIDAYHNRFTETMLQRGFTILDKIEDHNTEPYYPVTFFKIAGMPART